MLWLLVAAALPVEADEVRGRSSDLTFDGFTVFGRLGFTRRWGMQLGYGEVEDSGHLEPGEQISLVEVINSRRRTFSFLMLGTSMPMVSLPAMLGTTRMLWARRARASGSAAAGARSGE